MEWKRTIFLLLYSFFIISYCVIGRMTIGGVSVFFVSTLLMISANLMIERKIWFDGFFCLYAIFLLIRFFSAYYYGFLDEFSQTVIRKFPVAYVMCWSSIVLTKRTTGWTYLVVPLVFIGILNSLITTCQSFGFPFFNDFLDKIGMLNEIQNDYITNHGDRFGLSVTGVFNSAVNNGHISLFIILSLFILRGKVPFLLWLIPFTIVYVGLFFTQQRSSFYIGTMLCLLLFFITTEKKYRIHIVLATIAIVGISAFYDVLRYVDFWGTRISDINLNTRAYLWDYAFMFVNEHPLLGGYELFIKQLYRPPHNFILSAFVAGGFLGGVLLIYLIVRQFSFILNRPRRNIKSYFMIFSCLYLALTADSLFHNTGLVECNGFTLLSWGLVYGAAHNKKRYYENNVCN